MGVQKNEQKGERKDTRSTDSAKNEGEGSRTADRAYRQGLDEFMHTSDVENEAEKAKEALEGPEKTELEQAEQKGKRGPKTN